MEIKARDGVMMKISLPILPFTLHTNPKYKRGDILMNKKQKIFNNIKEIGIIVLVVVLKIMKNFLHGQDTFPELDNTDTLYLSATNSPYLSEYPKA